MRSFQIAIWAMKGVMQAAGVGNAVGGVPLHGKVRENGEKEIASKRAKGMDFQAEGIAGAKTLSLE